MKPTLLLSLGMLGCILQSASAQITLFTTTDDFAQFQGGAGVVSVNYYSDSSTANGLGNAANPIGGSSGVGSLQLTATDGWSGWVSGSSSPGQASNQDFLSVFDPGAIGAWRPESGYGPGTLAAYSGTMSFDLYRGNFTDWNWFGITLNYNGTWNPFWASAATDFTGADGRTWTHFEVPYNINAVNAGLTYFEMGIAQNAGSIAGQVFYVDNFQVAPVPEPGTFAIVTLGLFAFIVRRWSGR